MIACNASVASHVSSDETASDSRLLDRLLQPGALFPVYQPVFRLDDLRVVAHEGLIRADPSVSDRDPLGLLDLARSELRLGELELCAASVVAGGFGFPNQPGKLFVNISPQALLQHESAAAELLNAFVASGADPARFVVELTEHDIIGDIRRIAEAVRMLRAGGVRIALDDFGSGHSNFEMWHELAPDYVKLDRYLVDGLSNSPSRLAIVRSLIDVADALGTDLIVEGVEHEGDLRLLRDLGIRYGQGFLLGRPARMPALAMATHFPIARRDAPTVEPLLRQPAIARHLRAEHLLIDVAPVTPSTTNAEVARIFQRMPSLHAMAVVRDGAPVGLINRRAFMERFAQPFIRELHDRDSCMLLMSGAPIVCEADQPIEAMVDILRGEDQRYLADGFIIVRKGQYAGIGTGESLVRRVTELRIEAARYANPLTLLPGNIPITQHITRLLESERRFAAAYFDLDNFKPFNDEYGYFRGDEAIRLVASLLLQHVEPGVDFVGHVGGDDFVVLLQSADWQLRCERIITEFNEGVRAFFEPHDLARDGFESSDRSGRRSLFPLTTLSVGVAVIDAGAALQAEAVATLAASAKHQAKQSSNHIAIVGAQGD